MAMTIEELIDAERGLARAFAIALSPLSTFLLGGQLQTAMREQTSMAMHVTA